MKAPVGRVITNHARAEQPISSKPQCNYQMPFGWDKYHEEQPVVTKTDRVINHLLDYGSITKEQIKEMGITHVSKIIWNVRNKGFEIKRTNETYTLVGE